VNVELGGSVEGRPIVATRVGTLGPSLVVFGGIHGDEPKSVTLCERFLATLEPSPHLTVWVLCAANPDGLARLSKDNARGVDLNRNWPAQNWSPVYKGIEHPGVAPASEPETQALHALLARAAPRTIVALHSPFRTVNYDGAGKALAERMAAKNGYGASADIGYPTPGSFGTYYGVEQQLEVITLEIPRMDPLQAWQENREALHEALAP